MEEPGGRAIGRLRGHRGHPGTGATQAQGPGYSWMCHWQEELRLQLCDHLRVEEGFWENLLTKTRSKLSAGNSH